MGILDNSGDIILDIVLTDLGRRRLAEGNGQFKISKFAVSDDEINYGMYSASHPSGSDYYDINIMNSLCFEAITNNASSMNSKLISIPRNDLLYLPVLKMNELNANTARYTSDSLNSWVVTADSSTEELYTSQPTGIVYGFNVAAGGNVLRVHQGLDTTELSPTNKLDSDMVETQYSLRIDNRLGVICDKEGNPAQVSYVDDDDIATYLINKGTDPQFIMDNRNTIAGSDPIAGPRGTILEFKIKASSQLQENSYYLFHLLGSGVTLTTAGLVHYVDTYVRIEGGTTGYKIDVPVKFIKK